MNFLAHALLATDDDDLLIGAIGGDFVRGTIQRIDDPGLRWGVWLHRRIDTFTDRHRVNLVSRRRVSPPRRRYAGIITDMFYDHFLTVEWSRFSDERLEDFSQRVYTVLLANRARLPPPLQGVLPRMIGNDWLASYGDLKRLEAALDRIADRMRRGEPMRGAVAELEGEYDGFRADFLRFFPEVRAYVTATLAEREAGPP